MLDPLSPERAGESPPVCTPTAGEQFGPGAERRLGRASRRCPIYRELLSAALDEGGAHPGEHLTAGELLGALLVASGRLPEAGSDPALPVDQHIASELAYDVALGRLCQSVGIGVDVDAFTQPSQERCRLEEALRLQGIDLNRVTGRQ